MCNCLVGSPRTRFIWQDVVDTLKATHWWGFWWKKCFSSVGWCCANFYFIFRVTFEWYFAKENHFDMGSKECCVFDSKLPFEGQRILSGIFLPHFQKSIHQQSLLSSNQTFYLKNIINQVRLQLLKPLWVFWTQRQMNSFLPNYKIALQKKNLNHKIQKTQKFISLCQRFALQSAYNSKAYVPRKKLCKTPAIISRIAYNREILINFSFSLYISLDILF